MKNWSFGKLVGVFGGGFFGFIAVSLFAIKLISSENATQDAPQPRANRQAASIPAERHASATPEQAGSIDIVSVQLESTQKALREAQESAQALEQKLAQALSDRDSDIATQFQGLRNDVQTLNKRLVALEQIQLRGTDVQIVRPSSTEPGTVERPATVDATYTPPKGFVLRATMGERVWLYDGAKEISVLKGQEPPKPGAPKKAPQQRTKPIISAAQPQ